ncbi:MAG: hypothetical protein H6621_06125 [Halobacteriovoraceae bacterium]|nr:hypothetical protein [Halobacteriovoraceae bacterium]
MNEIDRWIEKINQITLKMLHDSNLMEELNPTDVQNRKRLIEIIRKQKKISLNPKNVEKINAIIKLDEQILSNLLKMQAVLKGDIKETFINKENVKKYNLQNLNK